MSAQKPVYSRPSDDNPTPAPKRKRHRKHTHRNKSVHTTDTLTASPAKEIAEHNPLHEDDGVTKRDPTTEAKGITKRDHLQDDGDAVAEHHPTGTDGQNRQNTSFDHHKRNRRTHHREKRRARELRAENERLHRRLAAIYDALSID